MIRRDFIEEQFKEFLKRHNTSFGVYINYNNERTSAFCSYEDIIEEADYCSLISDAFKYLLIVPESFADFIRKREGIDV